MNAEPASRPRFRTPGSTLLVWSAPAADRLVTGRIAAGSEVELLQRQGDWALVRTPEGWNGWVDGRALRALSGSARQRRWFAAIAVVTVLAVVAGGILIYARPRHPQFGGSSGGGGSSSSSGDSGQTSAALLASAYENGSIDRPTWLRYRAYSMFGVHALPAEYQGTAPNQDDAALAAELKLGDPLPPDVRSELQSYLGRPASPGSVFYGGGPAPMRAGATSGLSVVDTTVCDANRWARRNSAQHTFTVWARCTAGYDSRLTTVINILDDVWYDETGLMGQPIQDFYPGASSPADYGGDAGTDIYLIPRDTDLTRSGQTVRIDGINEALAVPAAPFNGNTASGYMLVDEAATSQPGLRSTLAHELFHILEYARNYVAHWQRVRFHMEENWFAEASAVWAETHFARSSAPTAVYQKVAQFLQNAGLPIDARGPTGSAEWNHVYQDFMWLFYLEQEAGAGVIADIWKGSVMATATTGEQATAAFDEAFPFGTHFAGFALRNLDDPALKPALGKTYQDLDTKFPQFDQSAQNPTPPRSGSLFVQLGPGGASGTAALNVDVDHLAARYYDVSFNSDVDQVKLDPTGLQSNAHAQANLVVLPLSGSPMLVALPTDTTTQLCDVKKIERAILVVSNGDLTAPLSGSIQAEASSESCTSAALGITSVTPGHVTDGTTTTVAIRGSGFAGFKNPDVVLSTPSGGFADILSKGVRVVNDSEIDVSGTFSAPGGYAFFDVTVFEAPGPVDSVRHAVCSGCLNIDAS